MLKQKQRDSKRRPTVAVASSEAPPIIATELTDDEKKARTEAVAAEIKTSLERHGCVLSAAFKRG
jgi:hypothetical protein